VRVEDRDPLGFGHGIEDATRACDDRRGVAALADALGETRRALEGLSYRGR